MKNYLFAILVFNFCTNVHAELLWGDVVKNEGGGPLLANYRTAKKLCENRLMKDPVTGKLLTMRIPNAHDWVDLAQKRGAVGVKETKYPKVSVSNGIVSAEINHMKSKGYSAIHAVSAKAKESLQDSLFIVDFYYSNEGYKAPETELGTGIYWSSNKLGGYGIITFIADYGQFDGSFGDEKNAVRCVAGATLPL